MAPLTGHWTDDLDVRADPQLWAALTTLATTASQPVDPTTRAASLGAVLDEARASSPVPRRRRRGRRVLALTTAQLVLLGGATAAAATGGLAATGSLPAPVQQAVHEVGARVGIGLPAAPGRLARETGQPASELAPGRRASRDGDETTTGRTYAPGQLGREGGRPGAPDGVGRPEHAGTRGLPDHANGTPGVDGAAEDGSPEDG